jgi:glutamine synthetase
MFGYSVLRSSVHSELYRELLASLEAMDVPIEGLHTETGPGVIEAAIAHAPLAEAADRAALFKTFSKVMLARRNLMATFMAKWNSELPGQSGHFHLSLEDSSGKNLFHDPAASDGMSALMKHFIAGQVLLLPQVLAMVCPTINSYRRLVPGMWAPTHSCWGVENRTAAVRAIPAGPSGTRSEYRIGPADANPYLVAAAALATGLAGIEQKLTIEPISGNAYGKPHLPSLTLSTELGAATRIFAGSALCRDFFGDAFVDHFAATRDWEVRKAHAHVSDWELARYFEII